MAKKVCPISPEEVAKEKEKNFPDAVFEAFNELIAENFSNGYAMVKQKEAVKRMVEKGLKESEIYKKGWLNIEEAYRAKGWKVKYDKPAYCEDYDAYFEFSKKE